MEWNHTEANGYPIVVVSGASRNRMDMDMVSPAHGLARYNRDRPMGKLSTSLRARRAEELVTSPLAVSL